jgi:hypothetical protein
MPHPRDVLAGVQIWLPFGVNEKRPCARIPRVFTIQKFAYREDRSQGSMEQTVIVERFEASAYAQMQQDMPIERLLKLQQHSLRSTKNLQPAHRKSNL